MDEKDLNQNEDQEFDLDSILNEFSDSAEDSQEQSEDSSPDLEEIMEDFSSPEDSSQEAADSEEAAAGEVAVSGEMPVSEEDEASDPEAAVSDDAETSQEPVDSELMEEDAPEDSLPEEPREAEVPESQETLRVEELPQEEEIPEQPRQEPLVYDPRAKLRELKRKLVAGPEKRYYQLSELGTGRLQVAAIISLVLVALCALGAVLFAAGKVPDNRMRFLIYSQVLAMLISGLLGLNLMIDGFCEIFHGRFSINTMVSLTFLACMADAFFCLRDLRVPCCCAFCLEMTFALIARAQSRNTEMGQMDTLRKAVHLHSLVKMPDYQGDQAAYLRSEGQLEEFWDSYQVPSAPRKLQDFYAFFSFLLCIGIAVLAGMLHGAGLAVQIFATSLLVAIPASFFIALTRPAAILERRLHMVGAVFCGWKGVKGLCSKAIFPLTDQDLFPTGSTKLNGVKFYSERDPDMIVSYTSSLIMEAGGGLVPVFTQLMTSRGVVANPVLNFRLYENGGIGGEVCGESVLLGSSTFLQSMGVTIPEGSMVNQAVYAAIDGQLCAVVAISYAKMRSAAAGLVTLCGYRKLTPMFIGSDFILTESYIRSKFEVKTRRLKFPTAEERIALAQKQPREPLPSLAISTRPDLISFAYSVTGARALRTSSKAGMALHLLGGILGLLTMAALAVTGSTELLTPINILLYQLVWMVPGFLITEWARHV